MHPKYSQPSALGGSLFLIAALTLGCTPAALAPASMAPCAGLTVDECGAKFTGELLACSAQAKTLADSLACEDAVRAEYGQPPRSSSDAGTDAGTADASTDGAP